MLVYRITNCGGLRATPTTLYRDFLIFSPFSQNIESNPEKIARFIKIWSLGYILVIFFQPYEQNKLLPHIKVSHFAISSLNVLRCFSKHMRWSKKERVYSFDVSFAFVQANFGSSLLNFSKLSQNARTWFCPRMVPGLVDHIAELTRRCTCICDWCQWATEQEEHARQDGEEVPLFF